MAAAADAPKHSLFEDLRSLGESPRELWLTYVAKFFESVSIFSTLLIMTLWLSGDFGMSDQAAGWWAGTFSIGLSLATFLIGFVADAIGFRRALIIGFACSVLSRGAMSIVQTKIMGIVALMSLCIGMASGLPILNTAMRRYTTERNRSFAFSLYYVVMNIGAFTQGQMVDVIRGYFKNPAGKGFVAKVVHLPILGDKMLTVYKAVLAMGMVCAVCALLVALTLRKGIDLEAKTSEQHEPGDDYRDKKTTQVPAPEKKRGPIAIAMEVMREKAFWRFMLFVGLLVMVRLIFQHYKFTWPKYVLREMGDSFPLGKVYSINPLMIIVLVPIATMLTRKRPAFDVIVMGSFVSALSVFVLCLGASYPTILTMIALLSIGEALWSPRLYEYTAIIAPRGREASYMGLSTLPMFLAKFGVGPMSGILLARYCPETGPRNSKLMWLIIGLTTIVGPILIVLLRGVIEGRRSSAPVESEVQAAAE